MHPLVDQVDRVDGLDPEANPGPPRDFGECVEPFADAGLRRFDGAPRTAAAGDHANRARIEDRGRLHHPAVVIVDRVPVLPGEIPRAVDRRDREAALVEHRLERRRPGLDNRARGDADGSGADRDDGVEEFRRRHVVRTDVVVDRQPVHGFPVPPDSLGT